MLLAGETYWELMKSPGHWWFELTLELLTTLVFSLLIAKFLWPSIKSHITKTTIEEEHEHHGFEDHKEPLQPGEIEPGPPVGHQPSQRSERIRELEGAVDVAMFHLDHGDPEVAWTVLNSTKEEGM